MTFDVARTEHVQLALCTIRYEKIVENSVIINNHTLTRHRFIRESKRAERNAVSSKKSIRIPRADVNFAANDFDKVSAGLKNKVIFDGRNLYGLDQMKKLGYYYCSIGREVVK